MLAKVKRIFQHMVYVAYSLRLELRFLMDEFALPPDTSHLIDEWEMAGRNFEKRMKVNERELNGKEESSEPCLEQKKNLAEPTHQDASEGTELFLTALKSTVLSSSPFLDYPLPYLLTEAGRNMALRSTLPPDIYWSARLDADYYNSHHLTEEGLEEFDFSNPHQRRLSKLVCMLAPHPLMSASLTMEHGDLLFQALLSDFRAQGGQIQLTKDGMTVSRGRCKWLEGVTENTVTKSKKEKSPLQGDTNVKVNVPESTSEAVQEKNEKFVPTSPLHFNRKVSNTNNIFASDLYGIYNGSPLKMTSCLENFELDQKKTTSIFSNNTHLAGKVTCDGLASHPGGVAILLVSFILQNPG